MGFVHEWPVAFSEIALIVLVVQGFRRGIKRDRMIAAAFFVHFVVRTSLIPTVQHITGLLTTATTPAPQFGHQATIRTLLTVTPELGLDDRLRKAWVRRALYENAFRDR